MRVSFNTYSNNSISMGMNKDDKAKQKEKKRELANYMKCLGTSKEATVTPLTLMRGIRPNQASVFDTFTKIDDVTREINFVRSKDDWDNCLLEEMEEFMYARLDYEQNPTRQNFDHMEEEMGDIFYTAASMAKNAGINPEDAFRSTNRKFFNRINLMERLLKTGSSLGAKNLSDCRSYEKRALWNAAKRKIYDAQALQYQQKTELKQDTK